MQKCCYHLCHVLRATIGYSLKAISPGIHEWFSIGIHADMYMCTYMHACKFTVIAIANNAFAILYAMHATCMNYMNAMNAIRYMEPADLKRPYRWLTCRYSIERERFTELNVENTQGSTFTQSCYSTQNYRLYSTTKYTLSHFHIYIHICRRNQLLCMHVLYISTHAWSACACWYNRTCNPRWLICLQTHLMQIAKSATSRLLATCTRVKTSLNEMNSDIMHR